MKNDTAARIKTELLARIEPLIEDAAQEIASRLVDDAIFMTVAEYAKHRKSSDKTVRKWIDAGMSGVSRRGRNIRIRFIEADAWREDDDGATRRSAELDAHGAKR